jgi:hemolysin III
MNVKVNCIDENELQAGPAYCFKEELANTIIHVIGTLLSVVGLIMLISNSGMNMNPSQLDAASNFTRIVCFSIYGASLIMLFLASSLYHSTSHIQLKKLFKLFDHCAIYFLIVGTYTPLLLISLKGPLGYWSAALIWAVAISGVIFKIKIRHSKTPQKYKVISLSTYLGMGLISISLLGELYKVLPLEALYYFATGGLIYCLGVFFYLKKEIPYTHAIWHIFVLAAAMCHFFMIYLYV